MQYRFWSMMTDKKFALYYYDQHFHRYTKIDRGFKIFIAITSSSAIGSWIIWQQLSFVWAVMVASSQVLTAIINFLPYKSRIKQINKMNSRLIPLYYEIESKWFDVAEGILSEREINDLHYNFVRRWAQIEDEFFTNDSLTEKKKFIDNAQLKKTQYINNLFLGGNYNV